MPADFLKEDWFEKLVDAGFEPDKPGFFLSVRMYLDRDAVETTLRKIARTAVGCVVAFDYFSTELVDSRSLFMRYARAVINATDEPLKFGLDHRPLVRERVAAFSKFADSFGGAAQLRLGEGWKSGPWRALQSRSYLLPRPDEPVSPRCAARPELFSSPTLTVASEILRNFFVPNASQLLAQQIRG